MAISAAPKRSGCAFEQTGETRVAVFLRDSGAAQILGIHLQQIAIDVGVLCRHVGPLLRIGAQIIELDRFARSGVEQRPFAS